ncbi:YitT family protein [Pygmaiobacter massiliensis]|uniref:YitT family protein n=1 Tax=Pygmaiobacter massiliensis TaxID=1917873 RepID=UPI000C7B416A|nr:YitT family protein [Pygmaiobacter massiliensis]
MKKVYNKDSAISFLLITFSTLLTAVGIYFFKFPNHFSFGGVSSLAIVLATVMPVSAATLNFVISMILLVVGFFVLGKGFGVKTAYASILLSVSISVLQELIPLNAPLTDQPMLELCFAIALPSIGSAILFTQEASSGGTDVIAMILKKYTKISNIGTALLLTDCAIAVSAFFLFDIKTGLFALLGLCVKGLVIDNAIESINLCKYFSIVCNNPAPICDYIFNHLHRGASVCKAEGAYTHEEKYIIFTALRRQQAIELRKFIRTVEPNAFITVTNTSEIIGNGFMK